MFDRFTTLPSSLYEMKKLEIIFADNNKITMIDAAGFKNLPMLATLDLQNNNIEQVPPELGNCTQIKWDIVLILICHRLRGLFLTWNYQQINLNFSAWSKLLINIKILYFQICFLFLQRWLSDLYFCRKK